MTHAETELERLKAGFEKWLDKRNPALSTCDYEGAGFEAGANEVADMLWPFVAYALSDMQGSAEKIAMLNRFKSALGMELMAHERVGVDLQCTCNAAAQSAGYCRVHKGTQKQGASYKNFGDEK